MRSWNNTAIGTPNGYASNLFVKQLFGSAIPAKGIEIQAGGLGIVKGENSEITSYDNDGYIEGERVSIKRPRTFHVDELSVSVGYLGDSKTVEPLAAAPPARRDQLLSGVRGEAFREPSGIVARHHDRRRSDDPSKRVQREHA